MKYLRWMIICCLLLASAALQAQDPVLRAMQDEMQRSMKKLRLEQMGLPYFISYKVTDTDSREASASFGSLLSSSENHIRLLSVEVRVGDYALDNSNFFSFQFGGSGVATRMFAGMVQVPMDDNYDELRRQIWLATDGAYKKALEDLSGKRSALQNKSRTDDVPDFSKEKPSSINDMLPPAEVDLRQAEHLTQTLSANFRQIPAAQNSRVRFSAVNTLERYINSEGSAFTRRVPFVSLTAQADTQGPDGMPLSDFFAAYGHSIKELPSETQLSAEIRAIGERLTRLQSAPVEDRYNGPVMFEDEAAAEVIAQSLGRKLPATPATISNNPQFSGIGQQTNPLLDKIDARVLPEFLSLVDNPTVTQAENHPLIGSYKVDEEGTPARETKVIENGYLKTVLTGRAPVRGVLQSTGNLRGRGVAPSNLFLVAQKSSSPEELKTQFLDMVKRRGKNYGIVIRRMGDPAFRVSDPDLAALMMPRGQEDRVEPAILAYRMYLDGHEELIRNAGVSGVSMESLKDIVAVSNINTVYAAPFSGRSSSPMPGMISPFSTATVVSYVVPSSLLFEELTVQKPSGEIPKPPVSKHPYFDK